MKALWHFLSGLRSRKLERRRLCSVCALSMVVQDRVWGRLKWVKWPNELVPILVERPKSYRFKFIVLQWIGPVQRRVTPKFMRTFCFEKFMLAIPLWTDFVSSSKSSVFQCMINTNTNFKKLKVPSTDRCRFPAHFMAFDALPERSASLTFPRLLR